MAKTTEPNNPVARLYLTLEKAQRIKQNLTLGQAWASVLGIHLDDKISLHLYLAELIRLVDEAERTIDQLDDPNKDAFLTPFDQIRKLLSLSNLDLQWENTQGQFLDKMTMHDLELAANAASVQVGEITLDQQELQELQEKVEELMSDVLNTTFPDELKITLMEKLSQIRTAITYYRINGLRGLRQAVEASLGAIAWRLPEYTTPEDSKTTQWREKLWQLLIRFAPAVISGATGGLVSGGIAGLLSAGAK